MQDLGLIACYTIIIYTLVELKYVIGYLKVFNSYRDFQKSYFAILNEAIEMSPFMCRHIYCVPCNAVYKIARSKERTALCDGAYLTNGIQVNDLRHVFTHTSYLPHYTEIFINAMCSVEYLIHFSLSN
jgi:hypothetical protein